MPQMPARKSFSMSPSVASRRSTAAESANSATDSASSSGIGPAPRLRACVRRAEPVASDAATSAIASGVSRMPVTGGASNAGARSGGAALLSGGRRGRAWRSGGRSGGRGKKGAALAPPKGGSAAAHQRWANGRRRRQHGGARATREADWVTGRSRSGAISTDIHIYTQMRSKHCTAHLPCPRPLMKMERY